MEGRPKIEIDWGKVGEVYASLLEKPQELINDFLKDNQNWNISLYPNGGFGSRSYPTLIAKGAPVDLDSEKERQKIADLATNICNIFSDKIKTDVKKVSKPYDNEIRFDYKLSEESRAEYYRV